MCVLVGGELVQDLSPFTSSASHFGHSTLALALLVAGENHLFFFFSELRMHFSGDVISTTGRGAGGDQLVRERERDERREVESMGLARAEGCGTNHGAEAMAGLRGACRRASPRDAFASSSRRYNFGLVRGWARWRKSARKSVAPVRATSSDEDDWDEIDKLMRELEEEERRRGGDADASSSFAQASDHADPAVQDPTPAVRLSHQTDQLPATKKKRNPPAQALIVHASSSLFAFFPPARTSRERTSFRGLPCPNSRSAFGLSACR